MAGAEKGRIDRDRIVEKYRSKAGQYKGKLRIAL